MISLIRNHHKKSSNQKQGNAILMVLVLIIIGTAIIILANQESMFFSKVVGFFQRSKTIQLQAEMGIQLAAVDLTNITLNSQTPNNAALTTFTQIQGVHSNEVYDQGLMFDANSTRELTPRISRTDGNLQLDVFYFPDDPCVPEPCSPGDFDDYDERLPKYITIISQARHLQTQEIFTIENRVQLRMESFAEIAYGITGVGPYPPVNAAQWYSVWPATYDGRVHFNIPNNRIRFQPLGYLNTEGNLVGGDRTSTFLGLATFQHGNEHYDSPLDNHFPFKRGGWNYTSNGNVPFRPILDFKKGFLKDKPLIKDSGDPAYNPMTDPTSEPFLSNLEALSNFQGINLSGDDPSLPECVNQAGPGTMNAPIKNICLKFVGGQVRKFDCEMVDLVGPDHSGKILNPRVDVVMRPNILHSNLEHPAYDNNTFNHLTLPNMYSGERPEVFNAAPVSEDIGVANGVIFCKGTGGCKCNLVIKGVYAGNITVAADIVTIAGDLVNADQDRNTSPYALGIIAKEDVVIPAGIPQGANTPSYDNHENDYDWLAQSNPPSRLLTDHYPPFTSGGCVPGSPCTPNNIAESYLGITNFIAHDGFNYVDRDAGTYDNEFTGNPEYVGSVPWVNPNTDTYQPYYNAVNALDIDAHIIAGGHFKVDGIFNPGVNPSSPESDGMAVLVCHDLDCTKVSYKSPGLNDGNNNGMYSTDTDGNVIHVNGVEGDPVRPMFWADGMHQSTHYVWPIYSNNQYDIINPNIISGNTFMNIYEAVPRQKATLLHIFGSLNSKYFYLNQNIGNYNIGFSRRLISQDPRAAFVNPPGYPNTSNPLFNSMYRKIYHGVSPLLAGN